jgi:AAA+ ATPase superfamily predicted ATPase
MAGALQNPFITVGYHSEKYFCDRVAETKKLKEALLNGRNVTLISWRRMGKTGLIQHVFHKLKPVKCVYIDILHTSSLPEFTSTFSKAIFSQLEGPLSKSINQLTTVFKRIKPVISFDALTGQPNFELNFQTSVEAESTLEDVFAYLKKRKDPVVIALDEFQQIASHPEKKTEALLRSYIQHLPNVQFIFSGSQKHILSDMFSHASRPFYQSTQFMFLEAIADEEYKTFIQRQFAHYKKRVNSDLMDEMLTWSMRHTFYVQVLCHRLFLRTQSEANRKILDEVQEEILAENEPYYLAYKNLLTDQQWILLTAIGKEQKVEKINKREFLQRYGLSASSVQRALKALVERELVIEEPSGYRIYDVFLSRWIERNY